MNDSRDWDAQGDFGRAAAESIEAVENVREISPFSAYVSVSSFTGEMEMDSAPHGPLSTCTIVTSTYLGEPPTPRIRLLATLAVVAALLGLVMVIKHMDHAPNWITRLVARVLKVSNTKNVRLSMLVSYHTDQWLSSDPRSKVIVLGMSTAALVLLGWLALYAVGQTSLYYAFWSAVDSAGLDYSSNEADSLPVRVVSLALSIGGMLVTALLLTLVSESIGKKVDDLKKGKSDVMEVNHVVVIGWSVKVFCLLEELCMGKEATGGIPIVVMAEMKKEDMEEQIAGRAINTLGSTIICRTGDPLLRAHLSRVSCEYASSIIVLSTQTSPAMLPEESDARMMHVVMNLMQMHCELTDRGGLCGHIVAEVCGQDHCHLLRQMAPLYPGSKDKVHFMQTTDLIARLMVQCVRYPDLADVLSELISFDGNECHIDDGTHTCRLQGMRFGDLQAVYPEAIPIGVKSCALKQIILNPPTDYVIAEGDCLVLVTEDETQVAPNLMEKQVNRKSSILSNSWTRRDSKSFSPKGKPPKGLAAVSTPAFARPQSFNVADRHQIAMWRRGFMPIGSPACMAGGAPASSDAAPQNTACLTAVASQDCKHAGPSRFAADVRRSQTQMDVTDSTSVHGSSSSSARAFCCRIATASSRPGDDPQRRHNTSSQEEERSEHSLHSSVHSQEIDAECEHAIEIAGDEQARQPEHQSDQPAVACDPLADMDTMWFGPCSVSKPKPMQQPHNGFFTHSNSSRTLARGVRTPMRRQTSEHMLPTFERSQKSQFSWLGVGDAKVEGVDVCEGPADRQVSRNSSVHRRSVLASFGGCFLLCGWRRGLVGLIKVLDDFVTEDSQLWLYSDVPLDSRKMLLEQAGLHLDDNGRSKDLKKLQIVYKKSYLQGSLLNKGQMGMLPLLKFRAIMVMADECNGQLGFGGAAGGGLSLASTAGNESNRDSSCLSTVFLLRMVQMEQLIGSRLPLRVNTSTQISFGARHGPATLMSDGNVQRLGSDDLEDNWTAQECTREMQEVKRRSGIVAELLDPKTVSLVKGMSLNINRYVMISDTISQMLALISCAPLRHTIFQELFSPYGNELLVRPAMSLLNSPDEEASFMDLSKRAALMGEIIIAYIECGTGKAVLNPPNKAAKTLSVAKVESFVTISYGGED